MTDAGAPSASGWYVSSDLDCFSATRECREGGCPGARGWTVPYSEYRAQKTTWYPIVYAYVMECAEGQTAAVLDEVPFLIDTGSSITVIPRELLSRSAFRSSFGRHSDIHVFGESKWGLRFLADLSLGPRQKGCRPLELRGVDVFIPNPPEPGEADHPEPWGLLGFNALRQIETVFTSSHVCFRETTAPSAEQR